MYQANEANHIHVNIYIFVWQEIGSILAAAPELAACPKVEVHLGPGVSKLDGSSMSPVGELLELGSRGLRIHHRRCLWWF